MKVALFSTYSDGGAGIAAVRLHQGLRKIGLDSTFFYKWKHKEVDGGKQILSEEVHNRIFEAYVKQNFMENIHDGNTVCTAMYPGIGFQFLDVLSHYDVYHFHWIASFISMEAIQKISQWGRPLIWTLHDQNPMTGTCHYAGTCEQYKSACVECPQMKKQMEGAVLGLFKLKETAMPPNIVVVSPSKWLADCARQSKIFKKHRVEVIENALDLSIYYQRDRNYSRKYFQLPDDAKVILFGANDLKEKRKGMHLLLEAVQQFKSNPQYASLLAEEKLWVLTFGYVSSVIDQLGIPCKAIGYTDNDEVLAMAYSSADVVALPSLEDNLPNIMLEGMACGTPVVSFATGGMKDVIEDGKNGFLVPEGDCTAFAKALGLVLDGGNGMRRFCREFAEKRFMLQKQAEKYADLYRELVKEKKCHAIKEKPVPAIFPTAGQYMMPYLAENIVGFQRQYNVLAGEKLLLEKQLNQAVNERNKLFHECNRLRAECENIERIKNEFEREKNDLEINVNQLQTTLRGIYQSRSWKWAARIKKCVKFLGMK